ncbi:hypothetical protein [Sphingomonas faeni]|uniref:hypothetical protein n=1 Tax=Sphingomonas faeni TaxID=185950 RepID=UPI00277E3D07|nr:hypothetical protein [Sphingomonas faeni]MDQ0837334.1 hypothetical protein [Sphingomonas faeni]
MAGAIQTEAIRHRSGPYRYANDTEALGDTLSTTWISPHRLSAASRDHRRSRYPSPRPALRRCYAPRLPDTGASFRSTSTVHLGEPALDITLLYGPAIRSGFAWAENLMRAFVRVPEELLRTLQVQDARVENDTTFVRGGNVVIGWIIVSTDPQVAR